MDNGKIIKEINTFLVGKYGVNNKYQVELDEFRENFKEFKNFRIVLYGIGRYTATLVEGLQEFHFVGLMDKDPANIGKELFGLPILDKYKVEQLADIIVINTSETYWDVIYSRIEDISVPVYYKNGQKAEKQNDIIKENPFKSLSLDELNIKIQNAEVVSFDFFDTLFMRKVCSPRDVFVLLAEEIKEYWTGPESFGEIRNRAIEKISINYSLDELYSEIRKETGLSIDVIEKIKEVELALEKKVLVPREKVLELFRKCLTEEKEVYLVSDMYLPKNFYRDVLKDRGVDFPKENILVSNELGISKSEGTIWGYYANEVVKGRKALHIGDHEKADVQLPREYEIDTFLIPNPWDMLINSSLTNVAANVTSQYDSIVMGNILKRLFADPFALSDYNDRITVRTNKDMGYIVFGPVILTFLLWLMKLAKEKNMNKLVFMSRDGYFLKEDFEYLCDIMREKKDCCYLTISRQLAMSAAIESEEDLLQYISMPYSGTTSELFEDRFGIANVKESDGKKIERYMQEHIGQIKDNLKIVREQYLAYIATMNLDNKCAIVDLGYYGNNQRYLNKISRLNMPGLYFNANCSAQNPNMKEQDMYACFQNESDETGEKSSILKKMIYLESFLTAPHGMAKGISSKGEFLYAKEGNNQKYFSDKILMNEGVKQFIHDYIEVVGNMELPVDIDFIDKYYGFCFDRGLCFADNVKQSFWNDNAMMNRIESSLFY